MANSRPYPKHRKPAWTLDRRSKRFWSYVDKNGPIPDHDASLGPCWIWKGAFGGRDLKYGSVTFNDTTKAAHLVAFYLAYGRWPYPCGLHKCDRPACVRPSHIYEGDRFDNAKDRRERTGYDLSAAIAKAAELRSSRVLCNYGHPLDGVSHNPDGGIHRYCKTCRRIRRRR